MSILRILFYSLILYGGETVNAVEERKCFDCVSILSCQTAIDMTRNITTKNREKLMNAYCGLHESIPKVCCSDFLDDETKLIRQPVNMDAIENHQNIGLLPSNCGHIEGFRILFHRESYEFAWLALISYHTRRDESLKFECIGSVINSRYILTAAHCVISRGTFKEIAGVRIGGWDYNTKIDCQEDNLKMTCESHVQDIQLETIIPHSDFTENPATHDIALLRLANDIDFSHRNAKPICLPVYKHLRVINLVNKTATLAGLDLTNTRSRESSVLMSTNIPILSSQACNIAYNTYGNMRSEYQNPTPMTLCAGGDRLDSCWSNSGGPLVLDAEHDGVYRNVQYGVDSYGPLRCDREIPRFYTDVTKYMVWILDNIRS